MNKFSCPRHFQRSVRLKKPARLGYALIEAVSMILLLGTIMSLASIAIHRSAQTQKLALRCIQHNRLLDDIHHRLLMDTRAAQEVKVVDNTIQLLNAQGQTIEYTTEAGVVIRTLKSNSDTLGRARWRIGARQLQVEVDASGAVPLAKYSLKLDHLLADPSVLTANATAENTVSSAVDTIHWISRLGVETQ